MKIADQKLTQKQLLAVITLVTPPLVLVIGNISIGRWINALQDEWFGWHSLSISGLIVLMVEFFIIYILAIFVRKSTGKTLVELVSNKRQKD